MSNRDSVFLGHAEDTNRPVLERKVLMVRRNDERGSWYLPGGGHPYFNFKVEQSIDRLLEWQTSIRNVDYRYLAHWKLTNGSVVRLLRLTDDLKKPVSLSPTKGDEFVTEVGWKSHTDLVAQHLAELTPWAQFKMAMFALDPANYVKWNNEPKGDLFEDEFRDHSGGIWTHPKFR